MAKKLVCLNQMSLKSFKAWMDCPGFWKGSGQILHLVLLFNFMISWKRISNNFNCPACCCWLACFFITIMFIYEENAHSFISLNSTGTSHKRFQVCLSSKSCLSLSWALCTLTCLCSQHGGNAMMPSASAAEGTVTSGRSCKSVCMHLLPGDGRNCSPFSRDGLTLPGDRRILLPQKSFLVWIHSKFASWGSVG